jgi:hypothetical protein
VRPVESLRRVQNYVGDAEEALRHASLALVELDTVAESSVGVLNEASMEALRTASETDPVRRAERLHDVTDAHLDRLRTRAEFIATGSRELTEHLDRAFVAADAASRMLETMSPLGGHSEDVARLQSHVARVGAVLAHSVSLAEQLTNHADAILKLTGVSNEPTVQRLLDTHQRAGRTVENIDLLRALIVGGDASSKTALVLTGDLTYELVRPAVGGRAVSSDTPLRSPSGR